MLWLINEILLARKRYTIEGCCKCDHAKYNNREREAVPLRPQLDIFYLCQGCLQI